MENRLVRVRIDETMVLATNVLRALYGSLHPVYSLEVETGPLRRNRNEIIHRLGVPKAGRYLDTITRRPLAQKGRRVYYEP